MSNYCLSIVRREQRNDGLNKPKSDINKILHEKIGFGNIKVELFNSKKQKLLYSKRKANDVLSGLKTHDILLIHYPTDMGPIFDKELLRISKKRQIKTIAFVHDIDSLRFQFSWYKRIYKGLKYDISLLNKFSVIISPNEIMTNKLIKCGLKRETVNLKLFDYLIGTKYEEKSVTFSNKVSFTGNLNKSTFINNLTNTENVVFQLYGPVKSVSKLSTLYKGSYESDTLLKKIGSGFGLIWDGNSITTIDDTYVSSGSYLKYNNPYKLSFYIAAGLPIFIWKEAAEANFVVENKIGYLITNIADIEKIILNISDNEYQTKVRNVKNVQEKIVNGHFTMCAVKSALNKLSNEQ